MSYYIGKFGLFPLIRYNKIKNKEKRRPTLRYSELPICLLGKKVLLDHDKEFIVKHQEPVSNKRSACLLFQKDEPFIYAEINHLGEFSDSFFIEEHETPYSRNVMDHYLMIKDKRKTHHLAQSDLKHALKTTESIKEGDGKLLKAVVDEYLQDIKHVWPSRLITIERMQGKEDSSIILQGLEIALAKANPKKAFEFLRFHRLESYIPLLWKTNQQETADLIKVVIDYYEQYNQHLLLDDILAEITEVVHLDKHQDIKELLMFFYFKRPVVFKKRFKKLYNRANKEYGPKRKKWLISVLNSGEIGIPKPMKEEILTIFKKKA